MKIVRQILLVMIGVLIVEGSLSARTYSCKMEELLNRTSLKYNLYIEDSGVQNIDNFLQLYNSKQKVYNKIYNYLKSRKDIKTLLTCRSNNECDMKAKALAMYATFSVTTNEKWNDIWFMIGQSALLIGDSLWDSAKNAYKISANTFLEPYKNVLDYLINFTDYNIQVNLSYINQKDKINISKILQNLIPTYSDFVKDPFNYDNISKIADDVSKIATIFKADKLKNITTLAKDIASLKNEMQYMNLYNEAITELKNGNSCIRAKWFSSFEINYLEDIPEFEMEKIALNITDIVKDITDILKLDKLSGKIELLSSMYKGVSFIAASQRTELNNILTFGGLVENKLKYTNDDLKSLIEKLNGINIYKFEHAIKYKDTKYITTFLNNYNKNLKYFKNYYKNEAINPQQNYLISMVLKATVFDDHDSAIDGKHFIEQKRYIYVDNDEQYFTEYVPINAVLYSKPKDKIERIFKISIWGKQGKTQNFTIDSNGFYENSGYFLFKRINAFNVPNTNIYYYKYMIYDENNNPIYIFANNGVLRGDKFTYNNGKFYIDGNYGIMLFNYDKKRASFKKIVHKYYAPYFENYAINNYYNIAGLVKNITIGEFKNLRKMFNNYIIDKKSMNINALKNISELNDKLNTISTESNYVPLWYAYAYFYSVDRILHNKKINEKVLNEVLKNNHRYISLVRKHMIDIINQQVGYLRVHTTLKAFNNLIKGLKNETK